MSVTRTRSTTCESRGLRTRSASSPSSRSARDRHIPDRGCTRSTSASPSRRRLLNRAAQTTTRAAQTMRRGRQTSTTSIRTAEPRQQSVSRAPAAYRSRLCVELFARERAGGEVTLPHRGLCRSRQSRHDLATMRRSGTPLPHARLGSTGRLRGERPPLLPRELENINCGLNLAVPTSVQPIESGLIGLEPISPELVLVDPELRAIVLRELQARFESNVEDNVLLPLRVVSPEAAVPPDAFGESPREVVRSWPRRLMQVAVVVAFGVGGYAASAWTSGDVGHASAESIARVTTTAVGRPPKASRTVAHRSRPKE